MVTQNALMASGVGFVTLSVCRLGHCGVVA